MVDTELKNIFNSSNIIFYDIGALFLLYLCPFLRRSSKYKIENIMPCNFDSSNYDTA